MAVYHFREGGTLTGAAGASTAADWTLANCYAPNENRWNDVIAQVDDGDSIIFYDEEGSVTVHDLGSPNNSLAANNGTITLRSKSGDSRWCVLTADGTGPLMDFTEGTIVQNYVFLGLTARMNFSTAQTMFRMLNATGDVTFEDCHLGPFVYSGASGTGFGGGILFNFNVNKNLEFHDTVVDTVSGVFDDSMLIRHNGSSGGIIISGDTGLEIKNVTISDENGQPDGMIYLPSGATLTSCTRLYLENITVTGVTASHRAFGGVYSESGAINATLIYGKNVNVECKQGGGILVGGDAVDMTIARVLAEDCEMVTDGSENDPGGVVFAFNGGTLNIDKIETYRCFAPFGTALYWGSGAGGTIGRLIAIDNDVRESSAAAYCGGFANQTIKSLLALRCGHRGTQSSSDAHPSVLLARLSSLGASAAKTLTIGQATIIDCTTEDAAYPMVRINTSNASYALNVNCYNWLLDNEAGKTEIEYAEDDASAELNLTINTAKLPNGSSDIVEDATQTVANGTTTITGVLTGSTDLPGDFEAPTEADAKTGGYRWWTGPGHQGADDEPFPTWDISLGALQSQSVASHPMQL